MKRIFFFLSLVLFCTNFIFVFLTFLLAEYDKEELETFVVVLVHTEAFFIGVIMSVINFSEIRIYGVRTHDQRLTFVSIFTLALFVGLWGIVLACPSEITNQAFLAYDIFEGEEIISPYILIPRSSFFMMLGGFIFSLPVIFLAKKVLKNKK